MGERNRVAAWYPVEWRYVKKTGFQMAWTSLNQRLYSKKGDVFSWRTGQVLLVGALSGDIVKTFHPRQQLCQSWQSRGDTKPQLLSCRRITTAIFAMYLMIFPGFLSYLAQAYKWAPPPNIWIKMICLLNFYINRLQRKEIESLVYPTWFPPILLLGWLISGFPESARTPELPIFSWAW